MLAPTILASLYNRFSPRRGSQDCDSCDRQIADATAWCERHGVQVAGVYRDDAVSGKDTLNRPGLSAALESLTPRHVLVVRALDRLARDEILGLWIERQIEQAGAGLVAYDGGGLQRWDDEGRLARVIQYALGAYQRRKIAAKTSRKMRDHQNNGRLMGRRDRTPFGLRLAAENRLVEHPGEAPIVARVLAEHDSGLPAQQIASLLRQDGVTGRDGQPITQRLVAGILERLRPSEQEPVWMRLAT